MINSILNINISAYRDINGVLPKEVNLLTWLTSDKHREKVEQIRQIQDEGLQKDIKKTLPAITPAGTFSYRKADGLLQHSGFIAFDVDLADNLHISNFDDLKNQISHIANVAYCGLSVRGKGYWGLVPIPASTPEEHKWRFNALRDDLKHYRINLDPSGSDVCRLRIYSWDPNAYFNHEAKLYSKIKKPRPQKSNRPIPSDARERVEAILSQIEAQRVDITQGHYKDVWFRIAVALANTFNEDGRGYFHTVSKFHPEYSPGKTDRQYDHVLRYKYDKIDINHFFDIASEYGLCGKDNKLDDSSNLPKPEKADTHPTSTIDPNVGRYHVKSGKGAKSGPWDAEILELESFFKIIPAAPIRLDPATLIKDPKLMIESSLSIIKAQNGNSRYLPDMERLQGLMKLLSN